MIVFYLNWFWWTIGEVLYHSSLTKCASIVSVKSNDSATLCLCLWFCFIFLINYNFILIKVVLNSKIGNGFKVKLGWIGLWLSQKIKQVGRLNWFDTFVWYNFWFETFLFSNSPKLVGGMNYDCLDQAYSKFRNWRNLNSASAPSYHARRKAIIILRFIWYSLTISSQVHWIWF